MNRRKMLIVACATLAAVMALCSFLLTPYRIPYQFMEGAKYERFNGWYTAYRPSESRLLVAYNYSMAGTLEEVTEAAERELPRSDGWERYVDEIGCVHISKGDVDKSVTVCRDTFEEPARVDVEVVRPATWMDRCIGWFRGLRD